MSGIGNACSVKGSEKRSPEGKAWDKDDPSRLFSIQEGEPSDLGQRIPHSLHPCSGPPCDRPSSMARWTGGPSGTPTVQTHLCGRNEQSPPSLSVPGAGPQEAGLLLAAPPCVCPRPRSAPWAGLASCPSPSWEHSTGTERASGKGVGAKGARQPAPHLRATKGASPRPAPYCNSPSRHHVGFVPQIMTTKHLRHREAQGFPAEIPATSPADNQPSRAPAVGSRSLRLLCPSGTRHS